MAKKAKSVRQGNKEATMINVRAAKAREAKMEARLTAFISDVTTEVNSRLVTLEARVTQLEVKAGAYTKGTYMEVPSGETQEG